MRVGSINIMGLGAEIKKKVNTLLTELGKIRIVGNPRN